MKRNFLITIFLGIGLGAAAQVHRPVSVRKDIKPHTESIQAYADSLDAARDSIFSRKTPGWKRDSRLRRNKMQLFMPLTYYGNNVGKTVALLKGMERNGVHRILFSSSASIYATDEEVKVTEESALDPGSPYATTKFMVEFILRDAAHASDLKALSLRYFNPIGSDPKLRTGQQIEHPTHVLGKMIDAWMEGSTFTVTGVDWPTRDGSGIRDYIHVWDLARAHVAALEHLDEVTTDDPYQVFNIGTGSGVTVKELVKAFEEGTGKSLNVVYGPPRPGDVAGAYTVSRRAKDLLGWSAELTQADGIRDAIAWLPERKKILGY